MEAFPEFIHRNVLHRLPVGMALHPIGNAPYVRRFATERKWVTFLDTPLTLAVSVPPIALSHCAAYRCPEPAETKVGWMLFLESPMTVIQSALKAATFDLPIDQNLGYAYIVPFKNFKKDTGTKKMEATFILGWKGMHQLALRTGAYKTINVVDIREGELKSYNRLTEEVVVNFIEDEGEREKQPIIGYVGYYRLVNGAEKTIYMSKAAIEAHERKFRKGEYQGKGWRDDWDAMARKTVYRQLIGKWGVMSIDYQTRDEGKQLADVMAEDAKAEDGLGNIIDTDIVADEQTGEVIPQEVADNA